MANIQGDSEENNEAANAASESRGVIVNMKSENGAIIGAVSQYDDFKFGPTGCN